MKYYANMMLDMLDIAHAIAKKPGHMGKTLGAFFEYTSLKRFVNSTA